MKGVLLGKTGGTRRCNTQSQLKEYSSHITSVNDYHKLNNLNRHKVIILQCWEVRHHKIKVWQSCFLLQALWENLCPYLSSFYLEAAFYSWILVPSSTFRASSIVFSNLSLLSLSHLCFGHHLFSD